VVELGSNVVWCRKLRPRKLRQYNQCGSSTSISIRAGGPQDGCREIRAHLVDVCGQLSRSEHGVVLRRHVSVGSNLANELVVQTLQDRVDHVPLLRDVLLRIDQDLLRYSPSDEFWSGALRERARVRKSHVRPVPVAGQLGSRHPAEADRMRSRIVPMPEQRVPERSDDVIRCVESLLENAVAGPDAGHDAKHILCILSKPAPGPFRPPGLVGSVDVHPISLLCLKRTMLVR